MTSLKRLLTLLALAGVFLLASFMGGMTHSIVADLTRGAHKAWWWGGALLVVSCAGILVWYRRRRAVRAMPADQKSSPRT
jgi:hypothetical protein